MADDALVAVTCEAALGTTAKKTEKGSTERKAVAESTAPASWGAEVSDLVTARLSEGLVNWILNRKRPVLEEMEDPDEYYSRMMSDPDRPAVYTQEFLEEERETMRLIAAKVAGRASGRFERFQNWVRLQLDGKGYVEIGEAYIANWIRTRQSHTDEQWDALMGGLNLVDDDEEWAALVRRLKLGDDDR